MDNSDLVWRSFIRIAVSIVGLLIFCQLIALYMISDINLLSKAPSESDLARIRGVARPVIDDVLAYHARHGRFPDSDKIGREVSVALPDGLHYQSFDSGRMCLIAFGDLRRDGFNYSWFSETSDWMLDLGPEKD